MALKVRMRAAIALIFVSTAVCTVAACGSDGVKVSSDLLPQDKQIVEAALTNGTFLDCAEWLTNNTKLFGGTDYMLDCDWDHPRTLHDPTLQSAGTFQVVQMRFKDGRVLNCLNFDVNGNAVPDCDWNHPVKEKES